MAKKKRQEEKGQQGAPDWIVTFADMISLLVTFFILMMTFSSLEVYDAFSITRDLISTTGVLTGAQGTSAVPPPEVDMMSAMDAVRGATSTHARPIEELQENLDEMGQRATSEHVEIDLKEERDGLLITFDDRASFAPGSAALSPYLEGALTELANVIEHYSFLVCVEGHTDDQFKSTPTYPHAEALGAARASAAAQWMVANSKLSPALVQVSTGGMDHPVAPNDHVDGRRANRRVEVRLLSVARNRRGEIADQERQEAR